jgi:hypothetical protein
VALNYSRRKVDITVAEDQNFAMSREMKEARRSLNRDLFPNDLVSPLATRHLGREMSAKNVIESAPTLGIQYPNRGALSVRSGPIRLSAFHVRRGKNPIAWSCVRREVSPCPKRLGKGMSSSFGASGSGAQWVVWLVVGRPAGRSDYCVLRHPRRPVTLGATLGTRKYATPQKLQHLSAVSCVDRDSAGTGSRNRRAPPLCRVVGIEPLKARTRSASFFNKDRSRVVG